MTLMPLLDNVTLNLGISDIFRHIYSWNIHETHSDGAQLVHILDVNFSRFILLKLPASWVIHQGIAYCSSRWKVHTRLQFASSFLFYALWAFFYPKHLIMTLKNTSRYSPACLTSTNTFNKSWNTVWQQHVYRVIMTENWLIIGL